MSNFEQAVETVLANEGGLTDHPADPGGITNMGITLPVLRADGRYGDDIRTLTLDQARSIYRRQWWDRYNYGRVGNQWIATKLLDLSINLGPRQAHIITQRALGAIGRPVAIDGILGPITIGAINMTGNKSGLLIAMRCEAAGVYRLIVAGKPHLDVFLVGWLRRAYQ